MGGGDQVSALNAINYAIRISFRVPLQSLVEIHSMADAIGGGFRRYSRGGSAGSPRKFVRSLESRTKSQMKIGSAKANSVRGIYLRRQGASRWGERQSLGASMAMGVQVL